MGRHPGAGGGVVVHGAPTCGRRPQGCYDRPAPGAMAQLVARLVRNEKVGGSNPPSSTGQWPPRDRGGHIVLLGLSGMSRMP